MLIEKLTRRTGAGWTLVRTLAACALGMGGCTPESPAYRNQQTFESPQLAVQSLVMAVDSDDVSELEAIFGPEADRVLVSGDPVMDRRQLEVFQTALDEGWSLEQTSGEDRELIVGHERWPFPVPLVKDRRGWWFDTAAGAEEILARRIGRNELAMIGALRTYAFAQRRYAGTGHDGKPAGVYARRIRSTPGNHDGLYWRDESDEAGPSPLSDLAAGAAAEGYSDAPTQEPRPFHGYYLKILMHQGENAPGGAMDYVIDGEMTDGFAAIAYPAEYFNSGIMTFIVGPDGTVFEADLGEETSSVAKAIETFDPDDRWSVVD